MSEKKRLREVTEYAKSLGWKLEKRTNGRHVKYIHPLYKGAIFFAPHSECPRAIKNTYAKLERSIRQTQIGVSA